MVTTKANTGIITQNSCYKTAISASLDVVTVSTCCNSVFHYSFFSFSVTFFHLAPVINLQLSPSTLCYTSLLLFSISKPQQPPLKWIIVMGFIIASAVIRLDANHAFRSSFPSSLCLFDRQGQCEIDEQYKDSLSRTLQAKVVQLNRAILISVCQ